MVVLLWTTWFWLLGDILYSILHKEPVCSTDVHNKWLPVPFLVVFAQTMLLLVLFDPTIMVLQG